MRRGDRGLRSEEGEEGKVREIERGRGAGVLTRPSIEMSIGLLCSEEGREGRVRGEGERARGREGKRERGAWG